MFPKYVIMILYSQMLAGKALSISRVEASSH